MLNAHPDIGTISEFDNMEAIVSDPNYLCSCGEKLRTCQFFRRLSERMLAADQPFAVDDMQLMCFLNNNERVNRLLMGKLPKMQSNFMEGLRDIFVRSIPSLRNKLKKCHARTDIFMRSVLALCNASVFLDATKDPYRMLFLTERHDVHAIYLFKNGVAGAYSYMKAAAKEGNPITMLEAGTRWFEEQITILRALKKLPAERQLRVSYSSLCRNPQEIVSQIHLLLGLPQASIEKFWEAPHHIVGNQMRLSQFSEIKEREDWKDNLSGADISDYRRLYERYIDQLEALFPGISSDIWK
ncbi:MAG: hypothetical protein M0P70_09430 [Desulfobulbaceae bacterium]|nr:hypothetical protein [Desulfobulbaceae bacterium]